MSDTVTFTAEEINEIATSVENCAVDSRSMHFPGDGRDKDVVNAYKGATLLRMIAISLTAHADLTRPTE